MADLHKEQLEEQLGDAFLALLMEEYAEVGGRSLTDAYQSSGVTMPEALDAACQAEFQKAYQKAKKGTLLRCTVNRAAKIAAVFFLVLSLSVNLILSVEAIRVPLLNFYLDTKRHFSSLSFNPSEDADPDSQEVSLPVSVPKGYRIIKKSHNYEDFASLRNDSILFLAYQNEDGHILMINTYPAAGNVSLDTEDALVTEFELNGMNALSIQSDDGMLRTLWIDPERQRTYDISCTGLAEEDFNLYVYELSGRFLSPVFFAD